MSGLSRDSPTNRGYYAESSQARALTIGDLGHPLHRSTFCAYFLCAAAHKMYLHADMRMKEKALSHAEPLGIKPARYRTDDQLLAFWKASDYADCGRHGARPNHRVRLVFGIIRKSACSLCTSMPINLVREPALKTYSKGAPFYNVWVLNLARANALANSHTSFYKSLC